MGQRFHPAVLDPVPVESHRGGVEYLWRTDPGGGDGSVAGALEGWPVEKGLVDEIESQLWDFRGVLCCRGVGEHDVGGPFEETFDVVSGVLSEIHGGCGCVDCGGCFWASTTLVCIRVAFFTVEWCICISQIQPYHLPRRQK